MALLNPVLGRVPTNLIVLPREIVSPGVVPNDLWHPPSRPVTRKLLVQLTILTFTE